MRLLTQNPPSTNYDSRGFDYKGVEAIIARGTRPTAVYGDSVKSEGTSDAVKTTHKPTKPGEFGYPTREREKEPTDPEKTLRENRIMLDQIVEIAMKLNGDSEPGDRANRYLSLCAEESGLDVYPRIRTFQGKRLSDGRYKTTHWRCAFYPKGSDTREFGWVTTGKRGLYGVNQTIHALHIIDFKEMEEYMSKPRSPIELANAFFLTLERSSISALTELGERADTIWEQRKESPILKIRKKLGLAN